MLDNERKQQFSIAYLRAVASAVGIAVGRVEVDDDSVDVDLRYTGWWGQRRSPRLDVQLKCTSSLTPANGQLSFALPIKNYDDLRDPANHVPRVLVVMLVPDDFEQWLEQSG